MSFLFRTWTRWRSSLQRSARTRPVVEALEDRALPSAVRMTPLVQTLLPYTSAGPVGYTPIQIRHAYGFDRITFGSSSSAADGSGQTIAIVSAYDDPNIANDLHRFDQQFGLPDPTLIKIAQDGSNHLPASDVAWAQETALDVEWAHAMAPGARILLVEASTAEDTNLFQAAAYASGQSGVSVVVMSFGGPESAAETNTDGLFQGRLSGVTFVAASGDNGTVSYPAASPYVLAVGGTTLTVDGSGNRVRETAWQGSGGGLSAYEPVPSFQRDALPIHLGSRGTPDVAYNANPNTGFAVYDSFGNPALPWNELGGTSAGAPQWAALIAIANQGRVLAGQQPLDGVSQTLPVLYSLPASAFNDITVGANPGYQAGIGYDLVTGLGSPAADIVVAGLTGHLRLTSPVPPPTTPPPPAGSMSVPTQTVLPRPTGSTINGVVAVFTDTFPAVSAGSLAAEINWGDGTSSTGVVAAPSGTGFTVLGDHTYGSAGAYLVTITIDDTIDNATITTEYYIQVPLPSPPTNLVAPRPDIPRATPATQHVSTSLTPENGGAPFRPSARHSHHLHHPARPNHHLHHHHHEAARPAHS